MASSENTAVNELIARAPGGQTSTPLGGQTPSLVGPYQGASLPEPDPMHTTFPVTMPAAAPSLPMSYPVVHRAMFDPPAPAAADPAEIIALPATAHGGPAAAQAWTTTSSELAWNEPTQRIDPRTPRTREQLVGTLKMRHSDLRIVVGKVVLPMVLLVIAGFFIGGYVVIRSEGAKLPDAAPSPAPAAPAPTHAQPETTPTRNVELAAAATAEPAAAAPPDASRGATNQGRAEPAAPAETAAQAPMLVDVRIDSTPSGATVTLIDRGKSQFVGTTPVTAALDAAREYDLVFTFSRKAAQLEHLNPRTTRNVVVTLDAYASAAKPADSAPRRAEKAADRAPRHAEKAPVTSAKKLVAEPAPASPARKPAQAAVEPALDEGTLMVSSKPPCEIIIDGKPTGLTTPQRSIVLSVGNHKVTLVNSEKDIRKTVSVQITANTTEKVIEDLMQ